jgi:hypothetical protein
MPRAAAHAKTWLQPGTALPLHSGGYGRGVWIFMLGLVMAVALAAQVRGATVTATLDPADISLGDSTQLTVTVSGGASQPSVPKIDGLEIIGVGESTQISIVNGSMTQNSSRTYSITPQQAGTFTIPSLQSDNARSAPLTLHVSAGPSGVTQTPSPQPQQPQVPTGPGPVVMPSNPPPQAEAVAPVEHGKYGEIQITLPKKEFYEGELEPIEIKVLISAEVQASITDLPQFTSDGFTLNTLSGHPDQDEQEIDGHVYHVLTWHTGLTAVKPGNFTLNLSMPISVVVRQQMPDMTDPDALQNWMRNAMASMQGVKKDVNLTGTSEPLKVLPLPLEGRPANFSGAVGLFEAESSASPTHVNVGDPVTLTYAITGHGNFDRVTSDLVTSDSNWKTYSAKTKFDAQDGVGYAGTKTFEQPIIPTNGSITEVPSLSFSYFDPERKQYETCTTPPVPISVSGAPAPAPAPVSTPAPGASVATANSPPAPAPVPSGPDLRINRIDPGSYVATMQPVYLSPVFMAGQALPLLALLAGLALVRRQRTASQPDRIRLNAAQQAIRQQVAAMDAAMRDGQAGPFFVHARNALQQRLGPQWKMRPEAITVADVETRLGEAGANVRTVFEMADQAVYSDLNFADADLQQWRQVVVDELAETKK